MFGFGNSAGSRNMAGIPKSTSTSYIKHGSKQKENLTKQINSAFVNDAYQMQGLNSGQSRNHGVRGSLNDMRMLTADEAGGRKGSLLKQPTASYARKESIGGGNASARSRQGGSTSSRLSLQRRDSRIGGGTSQLRQVQNTSAELQNTSVDYDPKLEEHKESDDVFAAAREDNQPIDDKQEGEEQEDDPKYACENEYGLGP
jgi:hypothetical protein